TPSPPPPTSTTHTDTMCSPVCSMEHLWMYAAAVLLLLWLLVWLWRDSLVISDIGENYVFVTGWPKLKTILLDVTDSSSIRRAMEWTKKEVGDRGLWGLVNNAGRSLPMGPTEWMRMEDFHSTLRVNMMGVIEMTMTFLPLLKKGRGRVVNVASVLGRVAANGGGYCISKFAVESFSDCLRRDIHYFGIKVSIIEPGFFKTAVTSLEPIERELHRLWNQLSPEVRDSYGEKYFDRYIKVQRLIMNMLCDPDLSKVTNCMEHALTAQYPRTRYSAGWDAKFAWIPLSYAPACLLDFFLRTVLPRPAQSV
ncbi:11-cis retinol dehydrogenase-like, partial [Scleropages formosus]